MKNIIILALGIVILCLAYQNYYKLKQSFCDNLKNEKTVSKVVNTRDANNALQEDIYKNPENY